MTPGRLDDASSEAGDSGWWILIKLAAFVAVPLAIVYVVKVLMR